MTLMALQNFNHEYNPSVFLPPVVSQVCFGSGRVLTRDNSRSPGTGCSGLVKPKYSSSPLRPKHSNRMNSSLYYHVRINSVLVPANSSDHVEPSIKPRSNPLGRRSRNLGTCHYQSPTPFAKSTDHWFPQICTSVRRSLTSNLIIAPLWRIYPWRWQLAYLGFEVI